MLLRELLAVRQVDLDHSSADRCLAGAKRLHETLPPKTELYAFLEIRVARLVSGHVS